MNNSDYNIIYVSGVHLHDIANDYDALSVIFFEIIVKEKQLKISSTGHRK